MAKRYIALILAAILIISALTACSVNRNENSSSQITTEKPADKPDIPNDDTTFKLSYTQADSLNPFKAKTLNNQILAQLVFESLFNLDESYKSSLNIASSYEYTDSETLRITIKSGLKFSDGSALTAGDVKESFDEAKASEYWGGSVAGIKSCYAVSDTELSFRLEYPNSYAHNLLTFPIKSTQNKDGFPIGNGRYHFATENSEIVLKANTGSGFTPHITTIHLENIPSSQSIDNAINIGNISFAFRDLSSNSSVKISANKRLVNMNNLVYLGVNNKSGITANPYIRKAISLAVDRNTLVKSAYGGFAQSATGVFNPQFELAETQIFEQEADINAAKQAIAQSGISNLSVSLLVNSLNQNRLICAKLIRQQLEAAGFSVSISEVSDSDEYFRRIESESFNLYLGEIKIANDMQLHDFLSSGGAAHYGINFENSKAARSYEEYINSEVQLGAFLLEYTDEMPYIPLLYRKGMICFSKAMNGDMQGNAFDCFSNIEDWYFISEKS